MKKGLFFIIFFHFLIVSVAQIKVVVTKLPALMIENGDLFMASSLNNWSPNDLNFKLKKEIDNTYTITLPDSVSYFEYKFTQGNWMLVEGIKNGRARQNRIFDASIEPNPKILNVEIDCWEKKSSYVLIVKQIPKNTPIDAKIFVSGNFNNWQVNDKNYTLKLQSDGSYRTIVYSDLPRLEYKFTRGTWETCEGRESGKARPNRVFKRTFSTDIKTIESDIESWEDLTGAFSFFSIFDLLMLFAAFQGILLVIAIPTMQDYNRAANRWLVLLILVASMMVFLREMTNHRDFAQSYPKLLLLPNFLLFLYAPFYYFYISKLLFQSEKIAIKWQLHFILPITQFCIYLPYFLMESRIFKLKLINEDFDLKIVSAIIGVVGLISNIYYWNVSRLMIKTYKKDYSSNFSYEQNLQYLNTVLFIQAFCLLLWFFTGVWTAVMYFSGHQDTMIIERSIDAIWLIFSTIVYFLGYFAIHQPEIFKVPKSEAVFFENPKEDNFNRKSELTTEKTELIDENILQLKSQVEVYMDKHKPFENPKLTLHDLSNKLKIQPHILSKVINDGFEKNFFDLINTYRIEEFKKRMKNPKYKNFTLLSVAFEVGFNSKTAFNRSFKKITNQTPRDFFEEINE